MGEGWRGDFFLIVIMTLEKQPNPGEAVNFWLHPTRKQREKGIKTDYREKGREERKEGRGEGRNAGSM